MDGSRLRPRDTIDLDSAYDVRQWTEIFNVGLDELRAAVIAVGPASTAVRQYLRQSDRRKAQ
jgi:uncharacterized protein DUF3606